MKKLNVLIVSMLASLHLAAGTTTPAGESFDTQLNTITQLLKNGDYVEAQLAYENILDQPDLSEVHKQAMLQGYEHVNMKILFSKRKSPSTIFHEVTSGESLYVIAKKYSTTIELIRLSNKIKGSVIYPGMKLKIETGTFSIEIDKSENILQLLLEEKPIKTYRVATGEDNNTPTGVFTIQNKLIDPTWYKDGRAYAHEDPENILGTRWLGFDLAGYGIHGTTKPETIGKQASAGCVRMLNAEVEELYSIVSRGTQVTIRD